LRNILFNDQRTIYCNNKFIRSDLHRVAAKLFTISIIVADLAIKHVMRVSNKSHDTAWYKYNITSYNVFSHEKLKLLILIYVFMS